MPTINGGKKLSRGNKVDITFTLKLTSDVGLWSFGEEGKTPKNAEEMIALIQSDYPDGLDFILENDVIVDSNATWSLTINDEGKGNTR